MRNLIKAIDALGDTATSVSNGGNSFQLFVGVPATCPVWFLLVLPPYAHAAASMTSLKATDGSTSYHSREYVSFMFRPPLQIVAKQTAEAAVQ